MIEPKFYNAVREGWLQWLGTERLAILNHYRERGGLEALSAVDMVRLILTLDGAARERMKALCA